MVCMAIYESFIVLFFCYLVEDLGQCWFGEIQKSYNELLSEC